MNTTTRDALLQKIKAQKNGLPAARVPLMQRGEVQELAADGLIRIVEVERHGRKYVRLVAA